MLSCSHALLYLALMLLQHLDFAEDMDFDPTSCSLRMTAKRLNLLYHKVSSKHMRSASEWLQQELASMGKTYGLLGSVGANF